MPPEKGDDSVIKSSLSPFLVLRKGDLVAYDGHITIAYSGRGGRFRLLYPNSEYDIIYANGSNTYHGSFSRKVTVTGSDIGIDLIGFGRIVLWQ